jgi:dipeptidase
MHPEPATGATAAAMVAELDAEGSVVAWCAMTTPCTSVFLPLAVGTELPDALTSGTGDPDPASAWWLMKELGAGAMVDPIGRTPLVQSTWHAWERRLLAEVAADRRAAGRDVTEHVERMLRAREALLEQMTAGRLAVHGG